MVLRAPGRAARGRRGSVSGRNKFRELVRPIDEDPTRRARVEELGRAYDALIALHERRETGLDPDGAALPPADGGEEA